MELTEDLIGKEVEITYKDYNCVLYPWYLSPDCSKQFTQVGKVLGIRQGHLILKFGKKVKQIGRHNIKSLYEYTISSHIGQAERVPLAPDEANPLS